MKKLLSLAIASLLATAIVHPSKAVPIQEALASCLPDIPDTEFIELDSIDYEGTTHILFQVDGRVPWFTVPELTNGQCVNHYTRNEANNSLPKSPHVVAEKFRPIIRQVEIAWTEARDEEMRKKAIEFGRDPERWGTD